MTDKIDYYELKTIRFWVVPDAGSFILTVITASGKETKILITQAKDLEDYDEAMIPGRIYIDEVLVDLKSAAEENICSLLALLIQHDELGHKQGLAVLRAKEIIQFFESGEAQQIHALLNNTQNDA